MKDLKEVLSKLDEALPAYSLSPAYQKIVANLKKELLSNIKAMEEDDPGAHKKELAATNAAKTISQLSNIARDVAWDYESFIGTLIDALGGKEDHGSALFDPGSWDT